MHGVLPAGSPWGARPGKLLEDLKHFNDLQELKEANRYPDCQDPNGENACPLLFISELTPDQIEREVETCRKCHLQDEEYIALTTYGPAFRWAMGWMNRRGLGLEQKNLTHRQEQVLLVVNARIEAGKAQRAERRAKKPGK